MKSMFSLTKLSLVSVFIALSWILALVFAVRYIELLKMSKVFSLDLNSKMMEVIEGLIIFFSLMALAFSFDGKCKSSKIERFLALITTAVVLGVPVGYMFIRAL